MRAIVAEGGSARTHPFLSKIPIIHRDPEAATARLIEQLDEGQVVVVMQQVETVEEVEQAIAAMRFTSNGGVRPESGFERAAAYWGVSEAEYLERADVWPLNPNGELAPERRGQWIPGRSGSRGKHRGTSARGRCQSGLFLR